MNHKSFSHYINTSLGCKIVHSILLIHLQRSLKPVYSLISSKAAQVPKLRSLTARHPFSPSVAKGKMSHHLNERPTLTHRPRSPVKV